MRAPRGKVKEDLRAEAVRKEFEGFRGGENEGGKWKWKWKKKEMTWVTVLKTL